MYGNRALENMVCICMIKRKRGEDQVRFLDIYQGTPLFISDKCSELE